MTQKQNIELDLKNLEVEARMAHSKEAYYQVLNTKYNRIGISVVIKVDGQPDYIMEYILCALPANSKVDPFHIERLLELVKVLIAKNYSMLHRDDGWIICEKIVDQGEVNSETKFLKAIVNRFEEKRIE